MKMKSRSHRHDINSPRSRHIVNIRVISVWFCLYLLSNAKATFEVHEKNKQRWGWLEKNVLVIKKACISLVPTMKAYLIHILFCREFEVVSVRIVKKSDFLVKILWIVKWWFEDWPLWPIFIKECTFCSKNDMCRIFKRKYLLLK